MLITNPVIRGFAPDPSVVRVGAWYYLATSSFEWFPTLPIYRSGDLAHWEFYGSVCTAVPGGNLHGVPDSGGIWAPALSYADGLYWLVYSIVRSVGTRYYDLQTFVTVAEDPAGPWASPRQLPGHGFDPALFHEDGRHYLLNLQNDSRPGGRRFDGIVLTELHLEVQAGAPPVIHGARQQGTTHLLLQREELIEGPKITVRDGWYYLLLAQGGTGWEHGVLVARSRHLTGPYECDTQPLLTSRDDAALDLQKAGHGELLTTAAGDWFLTHLAARPVPTPAGPRSTLGREVAIQPIVWAGGWPRLAQGDWHPQVHVACAEPETTPEGYDGGAQVGSSPSQSAWSGSVGQSAWSGPAGHGGGSPDAAARVGSGRVGTHWPWSTLREEPGDWADQHARPGWLRLRGRMGPESLWQQSLLAQRITEHEMHAEIVVDAEPRTFTQSAGAVLWYNTTSYYQLHLTWAEPPDEPQAGQQWHEPPAGRRVLRLEHGHPDGATTLAMVPVPAGPVRLHVNTHLDRAQFRWESVDPQHADDAAAAAAPIGPELDFSQLSDDFGGRLRFTGAFVGISAVDLVEQAWQADFSGWHLQVREVSE